MQPVNEETWPNHVLADTAALAAITSYLHSGHGLTYLNDTIDESTQGEVTTSPRQMFSYPVDLKVQ